MREQVQSGHFHGGWFPRGVAAQDPVLCSFSEGSSSYETDKIAFGIVTEDSQFHPRDLNGLLREPTAWFLNLVNGNEHMRYCERFLQHGHVVVSGVPGWLTLDQWHALKKRAQSHGGRLEALSLYRVQATMEKLRAFLGGGMLGPLFNVRGTYVQYLSTSGEEVHSWQGSAAGAAEIAALYQWLVQQPIQKILCHPKAPEAKLLRNQAEEQESSRERSISVMLQFASGTIGSFSLLQSTAQTPHRGHLMLGFDGSLGSLDWDQGQSSRFRLQVYATDATFPVELQEPVQTDQWAWRGILSQKAPLTWLPIADVESWIILAEAARRSLQEGIWVDLPSAKEE